MQYSMQFTTNNYINEKKADGTFVSLLTES